MTSNKNTQNEEVVEPTLNTAPLIDDVFEPIGTIKMAEQEKYEQCEWVFQFDEDEPQIFAWTNESDVDEDPTVTFTIGNRKDAYITFTNKENGKTLKIFARELTDDGIKLRELQTKNTKVEENESENKED
jgi:hypothetical protein